MKDGLVSSGLSGSEVGFAVLQRFGLTSRIQGPGSSIREWAAGGEDYGRRSSPTQMPCEIQVEQPYTWHALLGWQQRKGGRCSAVALSAAVIGVQHGLGLFWSLLGAGTQAMTWVPSVRRGVQGQGCSCPLPCFLDGAHWNSEYCEPQCVRRCFSASKVCWQRRVSRGLLRDTSCNWVGNGSRNLWLK